MAEDDGIEALHPGMRLKVHEHAEIVARYNGLRKAGRNHVEACREIGPTYQRNEHSISNVIRRYQPTTDLAQHLMKASAFKLAARVVRKASVQEAIDILSRKNMGVLAPKTEEGGGDRGFFLSVEADSCGAVKVGVQIGPAQERPLDGVPESPIIDVESVTGYTIAPPDPTPRQLIQEVSIEREISNQRQGHVGKNAGRPEKEWSKTTRLALEAARNRVKKAHILRSRESARKREAAKVVRVSERHDESKE